MTDTTNEPNDLEAQLDEALDAEAGLDADPDSLAPLDAMIAERDQWKDRAMRAAAEADNVRRRTETQMNDARAFAIQRFAKDLLGVADNLERALMAAPKDAEGAAAGLVIGLELTQKSLLQALRDQWPEAGRPGPGDGLRPASAPGDDGTALGRGSGRGRASDHAGRLRAVRPHRAPGHGRGGGEGLRRRGANPYATLRLAPAGPSTARLKSSTAPSRGRGTAKR